MWLRIASGVVLAPLLLALVLWGPLWVIALVILTAGILSANEMLRMLLQGHPSRHRDAWVGMVAAGAIIAAAAAAGTEGMWIATLIAGPTAMSLFVLRPGDISTVGQRLSAVLACLAYIGMLFATIALHLDLGASVRPDLGPDAGRHALMMLFLTVWLGDTLAYFVGKSIGKHKLHPIVSPKKTWEGAFGGALGSIGGVFLTAHLFDLTIPVALAIGLGTAVAITEQFGDLCESLFKRSMGVKDSGSLIPGHGGVLDRLDGLVFAAPVVYLTFRFLL